MTENFLRELQSFVAEVCIGASALRNQGSDGLLQHCRTVFKAVNLADIPRDEREFCFWLDSQTETLIITFSQNTLRWGAARKALNLFLRDVCYNVFLNNAFNLHSLLPLLEVPVDSFTAQHLRRDFRALPKWTGLKHVSRSDLKLYQIAAQQLSRSQGINRVGLDVFFYRKDVKTVRS